MKASAATPAASTGTATGVKDWARLARSEPVLFMPRVEPHPLGGWIGLGSFLVGMISTQATFTGHQTLAWLALLGVLIGMLLHWRWKTANSGWRVDFVQRRVEPVALRGQAQVLEGTGWSIQIAPGDKRSHIAIDLRHEDIGRVARLVDVPSRGKADTERLNDLAEQLALRLAVPRTGLRL